MTSSVSSRASSSPIIILPCDVPVVVSVVDVVAAPAGGIGATNALSLAMTISSGLPTCRTKWTMSARSSTPMQLFCRSTPPHLEYDVAG